MKVLILTEGGVEVGFGHITRMLSVYHGFLERGITPSMVIDGDETVSFLLKNVNYSIYNWHRTGDLIFKDIAKYDVVVVDSYSTDTYFCEKLLENTRLAVFFDDYNRINYPGGIVVNGAIYAESLNYSSGYGVRYLLGPRYLPLRREFWFVDEKKISEKVESILVTLGGSDKASILSEILRLLKSYPDITKFVVVPRSFGSMEEIVRNSDSNTVLVNSPDAVLMVKLMLNCDIAISAGGQTGYELARVGLPSILVAVTENQLLNCLGLERAGCARYAGFWNRDDVCYNIFRFLEELMDYGVRKNMSDSGRGIIDGLGAIRVVDEIIGALR